MPTAGLRKIIRYSGEIKVTAVKLSFLQGVLIQDVAREMAAMMLLSSYFEAIWLHLSGEDSKGNSKRLFVHGFCRVFQSESFGIEKAAEAVY